MVRLSDHMRYMAGHIDNVGDLWGLNATVSARVIFMGATRLLDTSLCGKPMGTRWGYVRNIT